MIKNKHGDVPVFILVIGVFAIVAMALLSFIFVQYKLGASFTNLQLVEGANEKIDQYWLYKNLSFSSNEIDKILDLKLDRQGNKFLNYSIPVGDKSIYVIYVLN
jgi:hypothetical protein